MSERRLIALIAAALLATAACSGATGLSTRIPSAPPGSAPSPASSSPAAGLKLQQPWATASVTNVATGEQFRIADLVASGKVVFIETMAIWCSNCRAQQQDAVLAFEQLDPARVEWVGIDVESFETAEALARYREQNGFPFTYVIADTGLARALVDDFGEVVLSPPSVNTIVIGTDGRVTQLSGHRSRDELVALAREHGA